MKKKTLIIIICIIAAALAAGLYAGYRLGALKKGTGTVRETYTSIIPDETHALPESGSGETQDTEPESVTETSGGTGVSEYDITVLSIGDRKITMAEVDYHLYAIRDYYVSSYGENPWSIVMENGQTVSEYAKEQLKEDLIRTQILCDQGEKRGISLDEEDQEIIEERAADYMSIIGPDIAESFGITIEAVTKVYRDEEIANNAYIKILEEIRTNMNRQAKYRTYTDQEFEEAMMENYYDLYQSWLLDYEVTTSGFWERIVVGSVG